MIKMIVKPGDYQVNEVEAKAKNRYDEEGNLKPVFGFTPLNVLAVDLGDGLVRVGSVSVEEVQSSAWAAPVDELRKFRQGVWTEQQLGQIQTIALSLEASRLIHSDQFSMFEDLVKGGTYLIEVEPIRSQGDREGEPTIGIWDKAHHRFIKSQRGRGLVVLKAMLSDSVVVGLTCLTQYGYRELTKNAPSQPLIKVATSIINHCNEQSLQFQAEKLQAALSSPNGTATAGALSATRRPVGKPRLKAKAGEQSSATKQAEAGANGNPTGDSK